MTALPPAVPPGDSRRPVAVFQAVEDTDAFVEQVCFPARHGVTSYHRAPPSPGG